MWGVRGSRSNSLAAVIEQTEEEKDEPLEDQPERIAIIHLRADEGWDNGGNDMWK